MDSVGNDYVSEIANTLGAPSQMVKRKVFESYQPTALSQQGYHELPPVFTRMPVADQISIGLLHPDTDFHKVSSGIWPASLNGNSAVGSNPQERAERISQYRGQVAERRLDSWRVKDDGTVAPPLIPGVESGS